MTSFANEVRTVSGTRENLEIWQVQAEKSKRGGWPPLRYTAATQQNPARSDISQRPIVLPGCCSCGAAGAVVVPRPAECRPVEHRQPYSAWG